MPVTITYTGATPTVDADEDTWGDELNDDALAPIKVDLDALAAQGNASETLASGALLRAGGTMTGDIVLADAGHASALSVGFRGLPQVNIDADRTLALTDSGKMIRVFGATGRTITVPTNAAVPFPIGAVILVRNFQSVNLTVTRSSGVTLAQEGGYTDGAITLAPARSVTLVKEDTNIWFAK